MELGDQLDGGELLFDGARYGDLQDVVQAIDECKVSPDRPDEQGRTALHLASANGHSDIVHFLLEKGANPRAENQEKNTPLHWACLNGQAKVARLLLEHGANGSAINLLGRTPVDETLGKPSQDTMIALVNSFGKSTSNLDLTDDPEREEVEIVADQDQEMLQYSSKK